MIVSLSQNKIIKLMTFADSFMGKERCSIRELSQLIGCLLATFPAVPFGQLFYRGIEKDKIRSLCKHRGNHYKQVDIPVRVRAKADIKWWIDESL